MTSPKPMTSAIDLRDDKLRAILDGCGGVTPGPWQRRDDTTLEHSAGTLLHTSTNNLDHIARLDPQTVASMARELLSRRPIPAHNEEAGLVERLRAALQAWVDADKADDDFREFCERADDEGWATDPTGSLHVQSASVVAQKARSRAIVLRDAAMSTIERLSAQAIGTGGVTHAQPLRDLLTDMGRTAADPMWSDHVELSKATLRGWIVTVRAALTAALGAKPT